MVEQIKMDMYTIMSQYTTQLMVEQQLIESNAPPTYHYGSRGSNRNLQDDGAIGDNEDDEEDEDYIDLQQKRVDDSQGTAEDGEENGEPTYSSEEESQTAVENRSSTTGEDSRRN